MQGPASYVSVSFPVPLPVVVPEPDPLLLPVVLPLPDPLLLPEPLVIDVPLPLLEPDPVLEPGLDPVDFASCVPPASWFTVPVELELEQ